MSKTESDPIIPLSGKLPFSLTNDYLFRAFFQENAIALEGLCRAVLHLKPEDTISVKLNNPIVLGEEIEDKEFILDLAVTINNSKFLNLEMQAYHDPYWPERALSYTCRSYDNLEKGDDYSNVIPVHQIAFLNFTLFPKEPRFYSEYQLVNVSKLDDDLDKFCDLCTKQRIVPKPQIFSSKFTISVVDLNHIELANEEDQESQLDLWAQMFKATDWRDIQMLSQKNEYMKQSVVTIAKLTEEERIRMRCQARKDNEYWERMRNEYYKAKDAEYLRKDEEFRIKNEEFRQKDEEFRQKDEEFRQKDEEFRQKDEEFRIMEAKNREQSRLIAELQEELRKLKNS